MAYRKLAAVLAAIACAATGQVAAKEPTLEEILRPPTHELFTVSPDGERIAATMRVKGRMMLVIADRRTLKAERVIDPEERGDIASVEWVSPTRLFLMNSRVGDRVEQAYLEPWTIALDIDGTHKRVISDSIIDTLVDDDDHILVERCGRSSAKGCWTYVEKIGTDGSWSGPRIADAPAMDASFMADNAGEVRFAWATDDDDIQRLWLRKGDAWTSLNDESTSHVEVRPIGISRDARYGYLLSEQVTGPDVIERVDLATGAREVVLSDPKLDPAFIVWSADGREPIGAAYGLKIPRSRFWNPDHPDARLVRQLEAAYPDDIVHMTGGSHDGQVVVVHVSSDRDPGSFYVLDRAARKSNLVARVKPWMGPDDLSPSTPITVTARDGLELTGYLTRPLTPAGANAPLVVLPHGGPFFVRDDWGYDEETQILASHGYAVLRVNFRGSEGFGRAFEHMGYREWGGRMQDDLTDATRWATSQAGIDGSRVCIWGSSYGGYAALMGAVREPDLYRCAISTAGPTDLNLTWRWGDTHRSKYGRGYLAEAMGKDPAALRAASPVTYADRIKPALMLVHGVHDPRVAYEHARVMTAALEKAGKSFVPYFPKDETHGIYGEDNRMEYYTRILDFLALHIGGRRAGAASTGTTAGH